MFDDPLDDKTDTEKRILRAYDRNPDMTHKQIAKKAGCSASYVSSTIKKYRSSGFF